MTVDHPYLQESLARRGVRVSGPSTLYQCLDDSCTTRREKTYETRFFNTASSFRLAKDKPLTNKILREKGIPVPENQVFHRHLHRHGQTELRLRFPVVLKPVDGMQGIDVVTDVGDADTFRHSLQVLLQKYQSVMVEEQINGDVYRVFVFGGRIIDIVRREKPYVVGDGRTTLRDLVRTRNEWLSGHGYFPVTNFRPGLFSNSANTPPPPPPPRRGTRVITTNTVNFHNGAVPSPVSLRRVPRVNRQMFLDAHRALGLECSGIDFISTDIYTPFHKNGGKILEINSDPDTMIHYRTHGRDKGFYDRMAAVVVF
jgi:cyanophycin synthetase